MALRLGCTADLRPLIELRRVQALFAGFFGLNETSIPPCREDCRFRDRLSRMRHPGGPVGCCGRWPGCARLPSALAWPPQPAFAQGKLEAQYEATLAGIPVGRGAWTIDITDDQFSASAVGGTAGLSESVRRRFRHGRGAGPRRQRRAGLDQLQRLHHDVEKNRSHPHGARQRHHQGISRSSRNRRSIPTAFR